MIGFAFDVDGVLWKGEDSPIPGAEEALKAVVSSNLPHVFVTNGSGKTEEQRATILSKAFKIDVSVDDVILPTTSMPAFGDRHVLLIAFSSEIAHDVAKSRGWHNVTTIQELAKLHPHLYPVKKRSRPQTIAHLKPFEAVAFLQIPDDWGEAMQLALDVIRSSDGSIGGADFWLSGGSQKVEVHCGNPDFDYRDAHSVPRLTLGAFLHCVESVFEISTGQKLVVTKHGKPFRPTYDLAQKRLESHAQKFASPLSVIYAIG
jgi:HAD superfamily hydrolase (TIGR01456 family)